MTPHSQVMHPEEVKVMTELLQAAHESKFSSATHQMSKWVDHVLGPGYHQYRPGEAWAPAINLYEDKKRYCLVVDLAGLHADQINIQIESKQMVISGNRPSPQIPDACEEICMHLMEIDHGPFMRTLELPDNADTDGIEASYRGGYLWIKIPKSG